MSIFEYNGSALVAMVGKNCFAIAGDRRLGVQLQTIATDLQRIFKIHEKFYIGLAGLATDAQTLELAKDFVVSGTASESLYGACESMYKPDMEPEELFETISQALLASVDRDCLSGWGGHVFVVTPTEVIERTLKGRMD
ncbi:hypothetical protein NE237_017564 [Protea cynaroides]|uniref:Uncharacterized protein n=1 Tax=Protea cynaroides TaxID=273540 RepID=A0A9Q0QN47_9MAGN|nr:hypothetical protein NE237_017564 [Protea cynaroides]